MSNLFKALPARAGAVGASPLSALASLTTSQRNSIAEEYLDLVARTSPDAPYVVDKMPDNVNLLGFLHVLFPHARVIHCRRDLRDIALSCWQTCFGSIRWANDWTSIARRFTDYLRVDEHWRRLSRIEWLDLSYESTINDPEQYARRLIEYVGLEWEPNCLRFHETKRQVRTASLSQVREPIYRTSVARWRNYETSMRPFLEEMGRQGHNLDPQ